MSKQVKWSTQVGESKAACGYAHPFVHVPQFELQFVCDMVHSRGKIAISIAIKIGPAISTLHYLKIATKIAPTIPR